MKKINCIAAALSLIFIVLIIAVAITPSIPRGTRLYLANTSISLEPLHVPNGYRYLDSPTAIAANGNSYTVNDGLKVGGVTVSALPTRMFDYEDGTLARVNSSLLYIANGTANDVTSCSDFSVDGTTVYTAESGAISVYGYDGFAFTKQSEFAIYTNRNTPLDAHAITVKNGMIYLASDNPYFAAKDDVYVLNTATGELSRFYSQTDKLSTLCVASSENALYALSEQHITRYSTQTNNCEKQISSDGTVNIAVSSNGVYTITALNGINRYSFDLSECNTVCASASSEKEFFNTPGGITLNGSSVVVADTVNNRLAVYANNISYNIVSERPVSMAYDNIGTLYTAASKSVRVSTVGSNSTQDTDSSDDNFVEYTVGDDIVDIKIDINQNIYVLGKKALYRLNGDNLEVFREFSGEQIKAFCFRPGMADIYALTPSRVLRLGKTADTTIASVNDSGIALAVDTNGAAYVLHRAGITRYGDDKTTDFVFNSPLKSVDCYMTLSTITNAYVDYGDLIVSDAMAHTVYTAKVGARVVDDSYDVPDIDDGNASAGEDGIIRLANYDLAVYEIPAAGSAIYRITKGSKVITAQYDLEDNDAFSLILVDDLTNKKLLTGYVYKNGLSAPLPYTAPPDVVGTITSNDTKIYKWPSIYSSAVAVADRYDTFEMKTFVGEFKDDYGNIWYRVNFDGRNGYEPGLNLSLLNFEPVFVRPDYNAEIISVDGSTFAPTYSLTGDTYTQLSVTLPTGERVEVVGMFDSSRPYTQIKYLDKTLGTLTCYVPTEYIHTDDTNVVIIVAVLLIIVTLSLAITLISITLYRKNKRNNKDV